MPKLKVIINENVPKSKGKWQGNDPIFIHRTQITPGVEVMNFGRLDHGSIWIIESIFRSNNVRRSYQQQVTRLDDGMILRRKGSNETRTMKFNNFSYSAIWRLA
jgi:hypothetical protein